MFNNVDKFFFVYIYVYKCFKEGFILLFLKRKIVNLFSVIARVLLPASFCWCVRGVRWHKE